MVQFIVRAAQSAYNQAGYDRAEAYRRAYRITEYLMANLDACREKYGLDDLFDLAYRMAREDIAHQAGASLPFAV